ncbi:hypothetical protein JB92DRAFT_2162925 [Gautieria morchelliformis]|nr:hypothetical protein JB92DRAFT_2162925 [Gautieria morchelliformis]
MEALPSHWPGSSSAHDLHHLHQLSLAPEMAAHLIVSTTLPSPTLVIRERLIENRVLPTGNAGKTSPVKENRRPNLLRMSFPHSRHVFFVSWICASVTDTDQFMTIEIPGSPTGNADEPAFAKATSYLSSCSTSQCPPFHPRLIFPMCITVVGGETKYLGCGCISRPYTTEEDCLSSRCLKSQSHVWDCTHGYQANCRACVHAEAACARHHSCRVHDGYQQRFTHTSLSACRDHRRR